MKLIITRSFSKTKQVASFEPINLFCSVQYEIEKEPGHGISDQEVISISGHLDNLVRQEVERTIESEMKKVEELRDKLKF